MPATMEEEMSYALIQRGDLMWVRNVVYPSFNRDMNENAYNTSKSF